MASTRAGGSGFAAGGLGRPVSDCVTGSAGGRDWCGMGSKRSPSSALPPGMKTFARGLAMTTRGGGAAVFVTARAGVSAAAAGTAGVGAGSPPAGTDGAPGFGGNSGIVLAAGAPGGLVDLEAPSGPEAGRVRLGIGFVTAVDQAGGTFWTGAGVWLGLDPSGSVVAPDTLGRTEIWVAVGLAGRGGRLMRRVSRFGGGEASPSGVGLAESAISRAFYRYFRKYSMGKLPCIAADEDKRRFAQG